MGNDFKYTIFAVFSGFHRSHLKQWPSSIQMSQYPINDVTLSSYVDDAG